jgi:signal transduction histidine kinase
VDDARTDERLSDDELPLCLALKGRASVRELLLRSTSGEPEYAFRCAAAPVLNRETVRCAFLMASDVSERERALGREKKRSEFEQQLIGIVSHDLRNPLQVIRLSTLLTTRDLTDPAAIRRCDRTLAAVDRAVRMVDDLLDFTRIRFDGGLTLTLKPVNLHKLSSHVVDEVLQARPERSIKVESTGDGGGHWDEDRLAQVLQNLVVNALQHTTEGTPVFVRTIGLAHEVVLEVHNGGVPIPAENLPRLFEPFHRGQTARRGGGSLGLGLYITSRIVEAHAGSISVRSSVEEGTTFCVRLPRCHPTYEELET